MKRILVLSYWSLREPLNAAAVFPYLRLLAERDDVEEVRFVTMETTRGFLPEVHLDIPKVVHTAIFPRWTRWYVLSKADLYFRAVWRVTRLVRDRGIGLIIAKTPMAGAIAHLVHGRTGVPYHVESFEPHAEYMAECGVWSRKGLRFRFAEHLERRQLRHARRIITVTHNYAEDLVAGGVPPGRVAIIPSIVDLDVFRFREEDRQRVRRDLGIPEDRIVGVYVGKFGGLYYDDEAFLIFRRAYAHFHGLHVLVLSPMDPGPIIEKAALAGIPTDRFLVKVVSHADVPAHLSAADFAFCTVKPAPIKRYQCPIKNGEYWANGLPFIMTDGIADDHKLLRQGIGGSVFSADLSDLDRAFATLRGILAKPGCREEVMLLARLYKSLDIARRVYDEVL